MRLKRLFLLVAIIVVVFLLYKFPSKEQPLQSSHEKSKLIDEAVLTGDSLNSSAGLVPVENKHKDDNLTDFGDLLKINFVLRIKKTGEVVDTNDPALAKQFNISDYVKGPYSFILGNSGKLKSKNFDRALVGWKLGEKKTVDIAPSEKELFIKVDRTKTKDLYFSIPRYQRLPLKKFNELFGKDAKINESVSSPSFPWDFKIVDIKEHSAVGDPLIKENETLNLPNVPWPVRVDYISDKFIQFINLPDSGKSYPTNFGLADVSVEDNKLLIHYNPVEGSIINHDISLGPVSIPAKFEVLNVTESDFIIHRIDNLNDKWLTLEAEILDRVPDVKFVRNESILENAVTEKVSQK